jgi:hypothetical protein
MKSKWPWSKEDVLSWWMERQDRYPFQYIVKNGYVSPEFYHGVHASVVLTKGYRLWGFQTQKELDKFKEYYIWQVKQKTK